MNKGFSRKDRIAMIPLSNSTHWRIVHGKLTAAPGRPGKVKGLFSVVGEKLPYESLESVRKDMEKRDLSTVGVYLAHDSMGSARYAGRGNVFNRLRAHKKAHTLELLYYSFYIVAEKIHEREIETILIRSAGPQLQFNDRKKRVTIEPGNIRDYEPRTIFYERQYKKGKKA
jgi:hypothetical protein